MIRKAAVLVEGQDEEGVAPLGRAADRLVDALDESLALADGRRRVEGLVVAALRVDPGELGELAGRSIGVELRKGLQDGSISV